MKWINLEKVLLVIFITFYIIVIGMFIWFLYLYFCYSENNLQIIAVITAAILASTSITRTYMQNERIKKEENKNKKYQELFYNRLILVKITETFKKVLKNIENKNMYTDQGFSQLKLSTNDMINKVDSKVFFSFLNQRKADELMNIIARLNSIFNLIDAYLNEEIEKKITDKILNEAQYSETIKSESKKIIIDDAKNQEKLYIDMLKELKTHEVLPLFPTVDELIQYLDHELKKCNNKIK